VTALRPRARRLLFAYLASLMVFVAFALATTVREGPRLLTTGWDSLPGYLDALRAAVGMWDLPMGVLVVLQIGLLFVPLVGFGIMLGFVAHRAVIVGSRRWFPGRRRAYS
jgi:hypothetical protein